MSDMNKSDEFFNLLESSSVLIDIIKVKIQLAEATCSATTLESSVNGLRQSPKSGMFVIMERNRDMNTTDVN